MGIIIVMSLSGSCMFFIYMIIYELGKNQLAPKLKYTILRIALFFFLIPLPHLKELYLEMLLNVFQWKPYIDKDIFFEEGKSIIFSEYAFRPNEEMLLTLAVCALWFIGVMVTFTIRIVGQRKLTKQILKCSVKLKKPEDKELLENLCKELGIKCRVSVYECHLDRMETMSMGLWNPHIILSKLVPEEARELVLRHELIHIKRMDILIRMLSVWIMSFHWINPVVYMLRRELDRQCELSCDESVIQGMDDLKRRIYAQAIAMQACGITKEEAGSLKEGLPQEIDTEKSVDAKEVDFKEECERECSMKAGLIGGEKAIKERIVYIMDISKKKTKLYGVKAAMLVAVVVLVNSLTVFAYDTVKTVDASSEVLASFGGYGDSESVFIFDSRELIAETVIYEKQFTDLSGNVYPVEDEVSTKWACTHDLQDGYYQVHTKKSDGSCVITTCYAQRCTKCVNAIVDSLYSTNAYTSCRH